MIWAGIVLVGFALLWRYKGAPGDGSAAPPEWPSSSTLARDGERPTLVLFAHPHCACTRASLSELDRLLARLPSRPRVYVVFHLPDGVGADWEDTALWRGARAIPGVTTIADRGGREAARFGVATSGATLLYDARGRLRFAGGLTAARGHEGDSFGQHRIIALLTDGNADRPDSPVFGCPLQGGSP